jgi:hypothetical protein
MKNSLPFDPSFVSISLSTNSVDKGFAEWVKDSLINKSTIWNHVIRLLSEDELHVALELYREKISTTLH